MDRELTASNSSNLLPSDANGAIRKSRRTRSVCERNRELAPQCWTGEIPELQREILDTLSRHYGLSIPEGDLQVLNNRWYVTHAGLLHIAQRKHCAGIRVQPLARYCHAASARWVMEATVFTSPECRGFVGLGDADPSNVSAALRGAEMRIAETRAVNRALRKAYGVGVCSVERLVLPACDHRGQRGLHPSIFRQSLPPPEAGYGSNSIA